MSDGKDTFNGVKCKIEQVQSSRIQGDIIRMLALGGRGGAWEPSSIEMRPTLGERPRRGSLLREYRLRGVLGGDRKILSLRRIDSVDVSQPLNVVSETEFCLSADDSRCFRRNYTNLDHCRPLFPSCRCSLFSWSGIYI